MTQNSFKEICFREKKPVKYRANCLSSLRTKYLAVVLNCCDGEGAVPDTCGL
jgi:hypothetical protein